MSELAPVSPRERWLALDVLRGFALCGVLIGNMVLYSGRWAEFSPRQSLPLHDQIADWFLNIVVQSKAQTLLTLLFGFGFAIQLVRAEERGEPVMAMYLRRLVALLVLGLLHVTLLWWGDVTWTYAVAGFGLLGFLHTSNRTRVVWALIFIFVPVLLYRIEAVFVGAMSVFLAPSELAARTARMLGALRSPDHAGLWWEHLSYAAAWCSRIYGWYFLWTLGRFLLGYVAGKLRWFDDDGAGHLPVFRRLALWGAVVAVVATAVSLLVGFGVLPLPRYGTWGRMVAAAVLQIGYLAQTLAYVGIVMLLIQRPGWRRVLRVIAPAGRMPLTVYFSQSVICTFVYYGWGLGWSGSVGVAGQVGLAFAIFAVQLAICHLWIRRFRFGPLEWLWRTAVYLKPQPMRLS